MARRPILPGWIASIIAIAIAVNWLAGVATRVSVELMRSMTPFAVAVRAQDVAILAWLMPASYVVVTAALLWWLRPVIRWARADPRPDPSPEVQRRTLAVPFVVAGAGFAAWVAGTVVYPVATVLTFGQWSPELASQQVLSPLVNGFLAATTTYLLLDAMLRWRVVPCVFPGGRLAEVRDASALGLRGRLLVFLVAVAFLPLFTVVGLVRAAGAHLAAGLPVEAVMGQLLRATALTSVVYVLLGAALTQLLAWTVTRPLADVVGVLRRVRGGDVSQGVTVSAADEIGVLEDGVNALVVALREKARILDTFGRVVEPPVRDRLLAGQPDTGGEQRCVTILVCDLRGFTRLAETSPPAEAVATLNEFFAAMTAAVRGCGGVVDKFVGDALLVVFGLIDDGGPDRHARAGLRCGVALDARLHALNAARAAQGRPPLAMKVAVHTGEVVAGTVGAADRHEFTVVGDAVNVAVRLESCCGEQGRDLLVSEATWRLAGDVAGVALGPVGEVRLRGRIEPVRVWGRAPAAASVA